MFLLPSTQRIRCRAGPSNITTELAHEAIGPGGPWVANGSLEGHGWHALRRGFAITLHAAGVQEKIIQGLMRQGSVSVTMSHYAKALPAANVHAVKRLGNSFGQRKR